MGLFGARPAEVGRGAFGPKAATDPLEVVQSAGGNEANVIDLLLRCV
eukprot:CAMPEP_0194565610 /NCGR_PEP_ID=MMETSP0292-20121207/4815_1 /TAXON_ID=39354 /ORGANISM="Heterosigma akashiwo, Strain CCMP2393" /LENGTH=46 /DNA_ID= /DNA_START= /DNA_END= /DNA_ORIENTATION=